MSKKQSIQIIGGGLYGCILAYLVSQKFPHYQVDLIEGRAHLLSAFDSVEISGIRMNNGFHGIELPRAQPLFDFINEKLNVPFLKLKNNRGLFIQGHLVPFEASLSEWPESLRTHFSADVPISTSDREELFSASTPEYQDFIKEIAIRYADDLNDCLGMVIPWFFPADYILVSDDEGDTFRNRVRSRELMALYGHPEHHCFEQLQSAMQQFLEKNGINIHLSTKVKFTRNGTGVEYISTTDEAAEINCQNLKKRFFCSNTALIVKDIAPELFGQLIKNRRTLANALLSVEPTDKFDKFSEILCAHRDFPYIGRLNSPSKTGLGLNDGKQLIQVEVFLKPDEDLHAIAELLPGNLAHILNQDQENVQLMGIKKKSDIFFPAQNDKENAQKILQEWQGSFCPDLSYHMTFGPINMSKTWLWAENDVQLIDQ